MRAYRRWFHHNIRVRVDLPLQKFSWGQDKRIDRRSRLNFEVDGSLSCQIDHAYSRSVVHWLTDATAIYRRGTGTTLWHLIDATATYIISLWHLWESIKWNHVPATKPTAGTLSTVVWGIALFVAASYGSMCISSTSISAKWSTLAVKQRNWLRKLKRTNRKPGMHSTYIPHP